MFFIRGIQLFFFPSFLFLQQLEEVGLLRESKGPGGDVGVSTALYISETLTVAIQHAARRKDMLKDPNYVAKKAAEDAAKAAAASGPVDAFVPRGLLGENIFRSMSCVSGAGLTQLVCMAQASVLF
jgi:hypothetical protein